MRWSTYAFALTERVRRADCEFLEVQGEDHPRHARRSGLACSNSLSANEAKLTDLGLDSLSIAELMFDVADKYGIDIPDDRARFSTLGEGASLVD
jgi:acyl carrier protein